MTDNTIAAKKYFRKYIGIIAIIISIVSVIGTRLYGYKSFFGENGVSITQPELYLNLRNIDYIAANWPFVLQTDPYLDYPSGSVSSIGLFDYIAGTLTYITQSLQLPLSAEPSKVILLGLPIVFLALTSIPLYYLTKDVFNRVIAIGSVILYPLIPSQLYTVSTIGSGTSETMAVFMFFISMYFIVKTVKTAERNIITLEVLRELSSSTLVKALYNTTTSTDKFIRYSLLASLSVLLTGFTNSYALLLLTITTLTFTLLYASSRTIYDSYVEPVLVTIPIIFVIPTIVHSAMEYTTAFNKVLLSITVLSSVILLYTNRYLTNSPTEKRNTILNVLYVAIPTAIILSIYAVPQLNTLYTTATQSLTSTITSSYPSIQTAIWNQYGAISIPAVLGIIALSYNLLNHTYKAGVSVLVSGSIVTIFAAYYTSLNTYVTPFIVILAVFAIYTISVKLDIHTTPVRLYKGYQVSTVLLVVVLFIPIILYPVSGTVFTEATQTPSIEYQDTGQWFQENTPESGEYIQDPSAEYGLVNNHNLGYKLSYTSERPVVGTGSAANLDGLSEYMVSDPSTESPAKQFKQSEQTTEFDDKYVVLDWRSVSSEFEYGIYAEQSAENPGEYYNPVFTQTGNYGFSLYSDAYYKSLAPKLYHYHGSSVGQSPIVVRTERSEQGFTSTPGDIRRSEVIKSFDSMDKAESFVEENGGQIGGLMSNPTTEVSHVENYRLVHLSTDSVVNDRIFNQMAGNLLQFNQDLQYSDIIIEPSTVKTFEKVNGATLEGSNAYPNSEVIAQVQIDIESSEQPLVYRATAQADENGNYSLTVPYSTTGFDEYTAADGYTNPAVRPNGSYTVFNRNPEGQGRKLAQVTVTEGQIYGEEDSTITVGLSQRLPFSIGGGSGGTTVTTGSGGE